MIFSSIANFTVNLHSTYVGLLLERPYSNPALLPLQSGSINPLEGPCHETVYTVLSKKFYLDPKGPGKNGFAKIFAKNVCQVIA